MTGWKGIFWSSKRQRLWIAWTLPSRLLLLPSTQVAQAEAESAFGLARLARSFAISPRQSEETKFFNPSLTFFLGLRFHAWRLSHSQRKDLRPSMNKSFPENSGEIFLCQQLPQGYPSHVGSLHSLLSRRFCVTWIFLLSQRLRIYLMEPKPKKFKFLKLDTMGVYGHQQ